MAAVRTSETSVNFNVTTLRYIPDDSKLHTRHRENLKSQEITFRSIFWFTNGNNHGREQIKWYCVASGTKVLTYAHTSSEHVTLLSYLQVKNGPPNNTEQVTIIWKYIK
jgi:hypothetical protein